MLSFLVFSILINLKNVVGTALLFFLPLRHFVLPKWELGVGRVARTSPALSQLVSCLDMLSELDHSNNEQDDSDVMVSQSSRHGRAHSRGESRGGRAHSGGSGGRDRTRDARAPSLHRRSRYVHSPPRRSRSHSRGSRSVRRHRSVEARRSASRRPQSQPTARRSNPQASATRGSSSRVKREPQSDGEVVLCTVCDEEIKDYEPRWRGWCQQHEECGRGLHAEQQFMGKQTPEVCDSIQFSLFVLFVLLLLLSLLLLLL